MKKINMGDGIEFERILHDDGTIDWADALKYIMASNIHTGSKAKLYMNGKLISSDGDFTIDTPKAKDEALTITPTGGELTPGDVFSSSNGKTYKVIKNTGNGTSQVEEIEVSKTDHKNFSVSGHTLKKDTDNQGEKLSFDMNRLDELNKAVARGRAKVVQDVEDELFGPSEQPDSGTNVEDDLIKKVSDSIRKSVQDALDSTHINKASADDLEKAAKNLFPTKDIYDPFLRRHVSSKPKRDTALDLADKLFKPMRDDDPVPDDLDLEDKGDLKLQRGMDGRKHAEEIVKAFKETGSIPGQLYPFADPDAVYELCPEAYEFMKQDQLKSSRFYEPPKEDEKPDVGFDSGYDD